MEYRQHSFKAGFFNHARRGLERQQARGRGAETLGDLLAIHAGAAEHVRNTAARGGRVIGPDAVLDTGDIDVFSNYLSVLIDHARERACKLALRIVMSLVVELMRACHKSDSESAFEERLKGVTPVCFWGNGRFQGQNLCLSCLYLQLYAHLILHNFSIDPTATRGSVSCPFASLREVFASVLPVFMVGEFRSSVACPRHEGFCGAVSFVKGRCSRNSGYLHLCGECDVHNPRAMHRFGYSKVRILLE